MNPYEELLNELESVQPQVILVPAPEPKHEMHCVRIAVESNPSWYSRLCDRFPSSRRGRIRTRIKRAEVLRVLRRLAEGKPTASYLAPYLEQFSRGRGAAA